MGGIFEALFSVVLLLVLAANTFPLLYVILRWRTAGQGEPGLGTYAAMHYFKNTGLLVALSGVALFIYSLLEGGDADSAQRTALGLLCGGTLFFGMHLLAVSRQGPADPNHPVRRLFDGYVLMLCGIIGFAFLLLLFVAVFEEDTGGFRSQGRAERIHAGASWAGVYLVTYMLYGRRLATSRGATTDTGERPPPSP